MKIALVTGPFNPFPPGPAGGVERLTHDLARCFADSGNEVWLLGKESPGCPTNEEQAKLHLRRRGSLRSTRSIGLNLAKDFLHSVKMLRLLPLEADIWSTNAFWLPWLAQRKIRKLSRRPRLVVNANRYPKGQYRRLYQEADHFVAVSSSIAAAITQEAPWSAGRLSILPNPIDTHFFAPPPSRVPSPAPLILFSGRIHPQKGIDLLVAACRSLVSDFPTLRLRLLGPWQVQQGGGGEAYVEKLRREAGPLTLQTPGSIHDRAALAQELTKATVYVYPSIDCFGEALPIAPMEAMAVGTPIVLSRLDCFKDYFSNEVTGLDFDHLAPEASKQLADCLRRLLTNPVLAATLAGEAAKRMPAFSNEKVASRYLELFTSLIETRNRPVTAQG